MDQTKPTRHQDPFDEAPDTQFYWSGTARSTPMAQVEAAIGRGDCAVACAGAPGSGRTVFLYRLAEHLAAAGAGFIHPDRVVSCKAREPADHVPRAWQGDSPRAADKGTAVLLLDDVDQLSRAEMAQLRGWWTALREKREKVALVVSCAASAVDPDSGARRQDLQAMIDAVAALQPLAPADIEEVIRYRLEVAGWEWEDVFTQPALEKIAFYAKGTPKRLVQICSRVMTLAEESGSFPAGPELVKEAAHQLFLPSHLREFSKQISLGRVPFPGLLNESVPEFSPALTPAADTAAAHNALPEPRARLEGDHATARTQRHDAKPPDPVQGHEPMRHDEAPAARHQAKDEFEQNREAQAAGRGIARVSAKRRRLRGAVGVVAVCGMAVVTGAIGYILGQVDMKPVEVVRVIPQPEPVAPVDGIGAGRALPADNDGTPASPASEIAPTPEAAPEPEAEAAPEAAPEPEAEAASDTAPIPEPAPVAETAATPEIANQVSTDTPPPAVAPAPDVAPAREVAVEPVEPEPSEAFAGVEAEGEAAAPDALAGAAETAKEGQEAQVSEPTSEWMPPPLARLETSDGDDGIQDADSGDDATAAEPGRTSTAAQDPVTQRHSSSAASAAGDEQQAAGNDQTDFGFAEGGEALASVPAVEEPAVRPQPDSVVMRAQALLAQLDLYRDAIDGLRGERTIAAVRDFQKSMSMAETGEVNEALLEALEEQVSAANSDFSGRQRGQGSDDAAVEAAETLQLVDIMHECRGKEAEWVYIAAINRHVLCGGLSAESPNGVPTR